MRSIRASEVRVGDSVIWSRKEFLVTEIVTGRTGRLEMVSESRGKIFFNPSEMVDVVEDPTRSWCDICKWDHTRMNGECAGCLERKRVEQEAEAEQERLYGKARQSLSRTRENVISDSGVAAYSPSGMWSFDPNNAAQMASTFVATEEVLASHPASGQGSLLQRDFAAAEYWYNEVADAAVAALRVPEVFRDPQTAKRLKRLRNPVNGEPWGTVMGIGSTDHTLSEIYLDVAMAHSILVLDNDDEFLRDSDLDERVARHYRDTLLQWIDAGPVTDESLVRRYREIRFMVVDPVGSMTFVAARELALLSGVSISAFFSTNQIGSKRISTLKWKDLQWRAFLSVTRRLHFLAQRQGRESVLLEIRIPGAGEIACTTPDPAPRPPIGWFPDPTWRRQLRYFNGLEWTNDVSKGGRSQRDSIDLDPLNNR